MKVLFSNITYSEVKEKRANVLNNSISRDSLKEIVIHMLFKRLPFLCVFLMYAWFIIDKCFPAVLASMVKYFNIYNLYNSLATNSDIINIFGRVIIAFSISGIIVGIPLIGALRFLSAIADKILPRKTPIFDRERQNERFWGESWEVENVLRVMDEIGRLSSDDVAYSELIIEKDSDKITMLLKDSKCGLIIKQVFTVSHAAMMKKLKESGELDFTFMDEEWNALLNKYQLI